MARSLDGSTQWLEVASSFGLAMPLSMGCFFNMTDILAARVIMALHNGTANERYQISHPATTANIQAVSAAGGSTSNSSTTTNATAGVINHAIGVFASATSRASYLNGGGKGTNATSRATGAITTTTIGARNGGAAPFKGILAEVSSTASPYRT